jgi:alpha-amylase/alpha-mannosidase (GH57 family)
MQRYACIHCHFYQPPRENPWLETIEAQASAYPYHDWNERVTAECYAANAASRIVDDKGRIAQIVNNYARISFNFGPTLLSWMEENAPDVYRAILDADRMSQGRFSGHGSAIAQVYNHIILPLANRRDKETQIIWGIRDFEHRFGRKPEGMWLAETAVDTESLELLAAHGIKFTILAPSQAGRVRKIKSGARWKDVSGARIDPKHPYLVKLPNGSTIHIFFYDGPISRAVAFEKLLNSGEQFAQRLVSGFDPDGDHDQLMHIATDGESYGHHHKYGDMALAYALQHIEQNDLAQLSNYGEFLAQHPPESEAQIIERTAWSCAHGVGRWFSDCGCNSGVSWDQKWREPLRNTLDWLRDTANALFEPMARQLFHDPWAARNAYIDVILARHQHGEALHIVPNGGSALDRFLDEHARAELSPEQRVAALKLMEMQRHELLMYTSCGWFFDEVSGIETVKVIEYAGRVIQLAGELHDNRELESGFVHRLEEAKSNLPEVGTAADIYRTQVKPAVAGLEQVAAHYAIGSLFEGSGEPVPIFCYSADREDFEVLEAGSARLGIGRARITSKITLESAMMTFAVVHLGDHNIAAGVRRCGSGPYAEMKHDFQDAFSRADIPEVLRALDRHFGKTVYSLRSLFGDERRKILDQLLESSLRDAENAFRQIYDRHAPLLRYLGASGIERPKVLTHTAEFVVNANLLTELQADAFDTARVRAHVDQAKAEKIALDAAGLGFALEKSINRQMERFSDHSESLELLRRVSNSVQLAAHLQLPVNLWRVQNIYWEMARREFPKAHNAQWRVSFLTLGEKLYIDTQQFALMLTAPAA